MGIQRYVVVEVHCDFRDEADRPCLEVYSGGESRVIDAVRNAKDAEWYIKENHRVARCPKHRRLVRDGVS